MAQTPTSPAAAQAEEIANWEDAPFYLVTIGVGTQYRYHEKMEGFYERWVEGVLAASSLLGVSAFVALLGGHDTFLVKAMIAVTAGASAVVSHLGFAKKAKLHHELRGRYSELSAKMEGWPADAAHLAKAKTARKLIEKDEPPIRRLVNLAANNEAMRALGYPESEMHPLTTAQRIFGYVATFGMSRIEKIKAQKEAEAANRANVHASEIVATLPPAEAKAPLSLPPGSSETIQQS